MASGASTQRRLAHCLEPVHERCLIYADALYDIGRDLSLSGHPRAAVEVLERRLEIDNQTPVVQATLAAARSLARGPGGSRSAGA